jgi:hypothetical protein
VESDGTSGDRVSVAAHASVFSLKGKLFGFSMVEDRLKFAVRISIMEIQKMVQTYTLDK